MTNQQTVDLSGFRAQTTYHEVAAFITPAHGAVAANGDITGSVSAPDEDTQRAEAVMIAGLALPGTSESAIYGSA